MGKFFLIHISLIFYLTKKRQRKEFFLWKGGLSFIFRDKKSRHTSYATITIPTYPMWVCSILFLYFLEHDRRIESSYGSI